MNLYDIYGNQMELSAGSKVIDACDSASVKSLISVPKVKNLIDSMGSLETAASQFGVGNKIKVYPRSGLKELKRGDETIVVCKEIIPIIKQTNRESLQQYGVIYCDLYKGNKCFLTYLINDDKMEFNFSRYCIFRNNGKDITNNQISVIPAYEEQNKSHRR